MFGFIIYKKENYERFYWLWKTEELSATLMDIPRWKNVLKFNEEVGEVNREFL